MGLRFCHMPSVHQSSRLCKASRLLQSRCGVLNTYRQLFRHLFSVDCPGSKDAGREGDGHGRDGGALRGVN
jgi:hypothetical protein